MDELNQSPDEKHFQARVKEVAFQSTPGMEGKERPAGSASSAAGSRRHATCDWLWSFKQLAFLMYLYTILE